MQLPCHFSGKEKSVSSVFHRFFRPKHSHDFTLQARFYTFITKNKTQSQPNDFSSGWKNIFFLRMAYRPVPQIRPKTSWRPFKIVPYRLVFSLNAPPPAIPKRKQACQENPASGFHAPLQHTPDTPSLLSICEQKHYHTDKKSSHQRTRFVYFRTRPATGTNNRFS